MKQVFIFLLLVSVISCNSKNDKETSGYILQKVRTDSISLDSITTPDKNGISFFVKDDTIKNLFLLNRLTNTLYQYDWHTKSQINKIKFEKEGPNGVGEINYIYVKNLDSIFALNNYAYSLILFNQDGKRLSKYRLLNNDGRFDTKTMMPPTGSYSILPTGGWESPMTSYNNILYIAGFPNLNPYEENFLNKSRLSIFFDLVTGKISYFASYPSFYKDNKYFPIQSLSYFWTYNLREKKIIYSFPDDTYIHIYNFNGEKLKSVEVKSGYFDKIKPMAIKKSHNPENDLIHYMSASHFDRIIYDKYNDIYYRFVKINRYDKFSFDKTFPFFYKIIILDKNFNKLAEVDNQEPYEHGYYCVTKEGLYLQESRVENEDYLYFSLFKLKKL